MDALGLQVGDVAFQGALSLTIVIPVTMHSQGEEVEVKTGKLESVTIRGTGGDRPLQEPAPDRLSGSPGIRMSTSGEGIPGKHCLCLLMSFPQGGEARTGVEDAAIGTLLEDVRITMKIVR